MVEREHILEYLRSTLKESLGASVTVTRNLRKAASVTNVPAVFLVDGGDEVIDVNKVSCLLSVPINYRSLIT